MPSAFVRQLKALEGSAIYGWSGQQAHGFWRQQWRAINPAAGDALHEERPREPYTSSPLLVSGSTRCGRTPVHSGDIVRLRLTKPAADHAPAPCCQKRTIVILATDARFSGNRFNKRCPEVSNNYPGDSSISSGPDRVPEGSSSRPCAVTTSWRLSS